MTIVESLARYLAAKLGLPFEDLSAPASVFYGALPESPKKALCVALDGLSSPGGDEGTRLRLILRSDMDGDWPLRQAAAVTALLDGARDLMLTAGGAIVSRAEIERGFELAGLSRGGAPFYAATLRIYHCE